MSDTNNQDLLNAIKIMRKRGTDESISQMIDEVMKAQFLMPAFVTKSGDDAGYNAIDDKTEVNYRYIKDKNGDKYCLAFTDWSELRKWNNGDNQEAVLSTFDNYAELVLNDEFGFKGFVINPYGENLIFKKELVASLKQQKQERMNAKIYLGEPKEQPTELLTAISDYLKELPNVNAAYYRLMLQGNVQSHLIVVDLTGDMDETFDKIADKAFPFLNDKLFKLTTIDTNLGKDAIKDLDPFYKK
ncbi:enhanced serine sensitivity protein SseB [Clostridium sp. Marseille-P299]|uniref:enhanced serine sensitivity protein SseB n=1 Tax=Clostridium sp. Marseille-P299 TaxID=1805477 RepID=UPI000833240B|nr:enhanced serine sensitivity protein SseB [Clostridium sp. Marseille-P299]